MSALRSRRMIVLDSEWSVAVIALDPQSAAEVDVYLTHAANGARVPPGRNAVPRERTAPEMVRLSRLVTDPLWPEGTFAATRGALGSPR